MAVKELLTRIALRYDTYENWMDAEKGGKLVLLKGEIGLCEVPVTATGEDKATNAPTVLFKVGDGTKTFSELQWASAKAADVYSWAKASDVVYNENAKTITFVKGNEDGTDKVFTFNYVTAAEVDAQIKAITNGISSKVTALEGKFGETGEVTVALADHESRLDAIEGETGAIATAKQAAIDAAAADATSKANTAEANAKAEAARLDGLMDARVDVLEAAKANHEGRIGTAEDAINTINTTTIPGVTAAYEAADKAINDKIGGSFTATDTVDKAIKAAQQAADDAQADVDALTAANGAVTKNASDIAKNKADIEQLGKDLEAEAKARGDKDTELDGRLEKVEAFFGAAEEHDGYTGLDTALDTLKEIQDYLSGEEGAATGGLISRVAQAEDDIEAIEKEFAAGGRVAKAEGEITGLKGRADAIEATIAGYDGTDTIKKAIDAVDEKAQQGIDDAADAAGIASDAQTRVGTLEGVVGNAGSGLVQLVNTVKDTADTASSEASRANGRLDTAEGEIDTLQATVLTGEDSNANLRSAITSLQEITGSDSTNSNAKLREDIDAIDAQINTASTGLLARMSSAEGRVSAIESDYLKAADWFIIDCGSAELRDGEPVVENN